MSVGHGTTEDGRAQYQRTVVRMRRNEEFLVGRAWRSPDAPRQRTTWILGLVKAGERAWGQSELAAQYFKEGHVDRARLLNERADN